MKKIITALVFSAATLSQLSAQPSQPLSLKDCRRLALENNEQVMTANNAVEKAKLDRQIAFAQYLPKVDGSFTMIQLQDQDLLDIGDVLGLQLQTRGTYLAGINVTLPLYAGGQLTAANRLAAIGQKVSEEQRRKTEMQLIADVDNAYYQLIAVRAKVQMLEAYAQQMQGLYDQVKLAAGVQMATENDLLRITTKQNEVSYQLQKARNGEQLCGLALANIIGIESEKLIVKSEEFATAKGKTEPTDFNALTDEQLFQHVTEVIERERLFLDPRFERQTVIDRFLLSKERVGNIFSQSEHAKLTNYIQQLRLEYAAQLLIEQPERSIVQIATDSGFSSHKYFTDRFRQYFSMTPTEFRKARE